MTMKCIARGGTCTARKACATRATRARVATHSRVSSNVACRAARGTYNTDYAGVEDFMRHEKDVGSSEYQIARLSTRIKQLTEHLKEHKTDHATRRGLMSLLNKRNTLLKYLFNNDRKTYTATIESLGIRSRLADEL
mmetsp:Transcript_33/g.139  ORF Transcript_33/g.139 Transcript_33/m.139 type:complete len:137 (-) Transcript_33:53-463(-)